MKKLFALSLGSVFFTNLVSAGLSSIDDGQDFNADLVTGNVCRSVDQSRGDEPEDFVKISEIVRVYTEGTYEGDATKLESVFHPKAVMNGFLAGNLMLATPEPFIADMAKSPLKDTDAKYQKKTASICIDGKVAAVTLLEKGFPGSVDFTNYLHLIDDGSGWKIISKTFFGDKE